MKHSVNHPEAIQDKFVERYGKTWADMDFVFDTTITETAFHDDPMNIEVGLLVLGEHRIKMRYKDVILYSKLIEDESNNIYASNATKTETFPIEVKGYSFMLHKHEVSKLANTLADTAQSVIRGYELGLYL